MKPPFYHISLTTPAYLRVDLPDSSHVYTLGRIFKIGNTGLLSTTEDYPFYENIPVTSPYTNQLAISEEGEVSELISGVWTPLGQLTAVLFEHPEFLEDLSNGYFSETLESGAPLIGHPGGLSPFNNIKAYFQTIYDLQKFYPRVVMKVNISDYNAILALARRVSAAMLENISIFPNPDPSLLTIDNQATLLQNLITEVINGKIIKIEMRNQAANNLYLMLQHQTIYANQVGDGDKAILALSGFDIIDPPSPKPVPAQPVIKRIIDGPHAHNIKIYIEQMGQSSLTFEIQATTTPNVETSWEKVLIAYNSKELIIPNRVHGVEYWYRISASNAHGAGLWSVAVSFISQF